MFVSGRSSDFIESLFSRLPGPFSSSSFCCTASPNPQANFFFHLLRVVGFDGFGIVCWCLVLHFTWRICRMLFGWLSFSQGSLWTGLSLFLGLVAWENARTLYESLPVALNCVLVYWRDRAHGIPLQLLSLYLNEVDGLTKDL